ncbi:MAG: MBL fold metallo-hydrolase [Geminicoccaceae bacterium]
MPDGTGPGDPPCAARLEPAGRVIEHDLELDDVRVRNVPTSVHRRSGARATAIRSSCSRSSSCVAHLGHLHHVLTDMHLGELGVIDILLVPVDGSYTIAQASMKEVIERDPAGGGDPMHFSARLRSTGSWRS